jgi:hypothetical protein
VERVKAEEKERVKQIKRAPLGNGAKTGWKKGKEWDREDRRASSVLATGDVLLFPGHR